MQPNFERLLAAVVCVGRITSEAKLEAFVWPEPDDFDFSAVDETDRALPGYMKAICVIGNLIRSPHVPFKNYVAMRDAWLRSGRYPIQLD
jgi:hypothetical protein